MYLKRLVLKNFKSHKDTTIDFDLITSIVGKNNSGKTNCFRALKLLLHHEDWPATWIRYGQDSATIELTLCSGTVVTRKRTKTGQNVTIATAGKIETFEGKKDAAEFIAKAIGIKKITLDETSGPEDLNFVEVYDGPYLIGGRSDTVQRKIAGIVGANKIDDARARLVKGAKEFEVHLASLTKDLGTLGPTIDSARTFLQHAQNILEDAEELYKHGQENNTKLQVLENLSYHIESLTSLIPTNNVVVDITNLYNKCKDLELQIDIITQQINSASQLVSKIEAYQIPNDLPRLGKEIETIKQKKTLLDDTIISLECLIELKDIEEDLILGEFQEIVALEELKTMRLKNVCPNCGAKIDA